MGWKNPKLLIEKPAENLIQTSCPLPHSSETGTGLVSILPIHVLSSGLGCINGKKTQWCGLRALMSADTHPCKELFGVFCSLDTLPLSLSICHFSSSFIYPLFKVSYVKTWPQFALGLMQSYGHGSKSHTWTRTHSLFLTAFSFVILNSWPSLMCWL